MMNYNEFKDRVVDEVKDYLGDEYKDVSVEIIDVLKVNQKVERVKVSNIPGAETVCPSISIYPLYQEYLDDVPFPTIMKRLADSIVDGIRTIPEQIEGGINFDLLSENIIFELINTEQNEELLSTVPHREFNDLSVIYRVHLGIDENAYGTGLITNSIAKDMGKTEEELFELAKKNTEKIFPVIVYDMQEFVMSKMMGFTPDDCLKTKEFDKNAQYVITNRYSRFAANTILYDKYLDIIAEAMGTDLYILPSSRHECIVVGKGFSISPDELSKMVREVNMRELDLEDRLSNQVYQYDRTARQVSIASNNPNRSINDEVKNNTRNTRNR